MKIQTKETKETRTKHMENAHGHKRPNQRNTHGQQVKTKETNGTQKENQRTPTEKHAERTPNKQQYKAKDTQHASHRTQSKAKLNTSIKRNKHTRGTSDASKENQNTTELREKHM